MQSLNGEQVPQSRTTVIELNVYTLGSSSFYRNPLKGEDGTLLLSCLRASHCLAAFSSTLLDE